MSEKKTFTEHRPRAARRESAPAPVPPAPRPAAAAPKPDTGKPGTDKPVPEIGGPAGPDPTRYGDWESKGRCIDF